MGTSHEKIYTAEIPLGEFEQTIGEVLEKRAASFATKTLLAERKPGQQEFTSYSWKEIYDEIQCLGTNLIREGVSPGDRVALLSENRREMFVSVMALYAIGAVNVPIFFGYFPEQVNYILNHSQAKLLLAADAMQVAKVSIVDDLPNLQKIYVMGGECGKDARASSFQELFKNKADASFVQRLRQTKTDDPCVIMYTSGTTGKPKGVELTHRNIVSQQKALQLVWEKVGPDDRFLSYLPWHHCFGGLFETFLAVYNAVPMAIDGSRGKDIELLLENWKLVKPTIYFSVPMIYQMLITEMRQDPSLREVLFHPELRSVFTAAAPLPQGLYQIFNEQGVQVHEGWGLTEASPDITITRPKKKYNPGIVGEVLPGVELKIAEDGEVLCRGPNVMKGYYRNPEATARVIDSDQWLHTGDLGEVSAEGLRIVGRADGVFKLINGEKVPSAHIEGMLISTSKWIERVVAIGRGFDYVTAILFCNEKVLCAWAQEKNISYPSFAALLENEQVRAFLVEDIRKANQKLDAKYYRVRKVHLSPIAPSLARGELTPTSKVCRQKVIEHYAAVIEEMYHSKQVDHRNFITI